MEGEEEIKIGGDFNARTGVKGGWTRKEELEEEGKERRSKDKKINGEGRKLIDYRKKGVINIKWKCKRGMREEAEFTYIGRSGETVTDL